MAMHVPMYVCMFVHTYHKRDNERVVGLHNYLYVVRMSSYRSFAWVFYFFFFPFLFTALVLLLLFRVLRVSFAGCPAAPLARIPANATQLELFIAKGGTRIDTYSHVRPYTATRDMNHTLSVRRRFRLWPLYVFLSRFYCCCRYRDGAVADILWQ